MSKTYCYKFKPSVIEVEENNAYAKPLIEKYGFRPVQEDFTDEKGNPISSWTGIWAKKIEINKNSSIAKWVKRKIEKIYKKEKEIPDSKWIKELNDSGYQFDEKGKLLENSKYLEGLGGQLCVSHDEPYAGVLYISMDGCAEFYNTNALDEACKKEINALLKDRVIFQTVLKAKKHKVKPSFVNYVTEEEKKVKKPKKSTKGKFIIKTPYGYLVDIDKYSSIKDKAMIFSNFKDAKKIVKDLGGKIISL